MHRAEGNCRRRSPVALGVHFVLAPQPAASEPHPGGPNQSELIALAPAIASGEGPPRGWLSLDARGRATCVQRPSRWMEVGVGGTGSAGRSGSAGRTGSAGVRRVSLNSDPGVPLEPLPTDLRTAAKSDDIREMPANGHFRGTGVTVTWGSPKPLLEVRFLGPPLRRRRHGLGDRA